MLRIITGELKGRKLHTVPGKNTRPTSDRLRESIFSILSHRVSKSVVLDLFSGTGALGIEALSRGAKFCTFVDYNKQAIKVIENNVHLCSLENKASVIRWDIGKNLNFLKSTRKLYDLIFLDPPYDQHLILVTLDHLHRSQVLISGACIVVEHSVSEEIPTNIKGFQLEEQRKYGNTIATFLNYVT